MYYMPLGGQVLTCQLDWHRTPCDSCCTALYMVSNNILAAVWVTLLYCMLWSTTVDSPVICSTSKQTLGQWSGVWSVGGSFGTGYCCGCIGVFWLSIKANVYVQYQKETRTSKIWISTTPRHQASVGKKISTSNQNLKIFFFKENLRFSVHCSAL